ncbi:unnamed protein product [Rotaria sordida]|uniref:Uncharacterized protein n=2 Tax=Rotaria sordida TaxID=392033 RepID=A0A814S408_9BILA|nr:unnamed protein product [Rotaria sordida]
MSDESLDNSSDDSDYEEQNTTLFDGLQKFSLDYMQRALDYYDAMDPKTQKRRHTIKSVMRRFPRITHRRYLSRFRTYLQNNGTKKQKIDCINDYTVTKREVADEDIINKSIEHFIEEVRDLLPSYNHRSILNTDQTAFEFEMHSTRTLSYVGEKATLSAVRSKNKITHRYTVQPTINLAGQIVGPVFVCLQEKDGRMGERVRKNLFHANNVVTSCSSSGKLNTSLVQYWINNCLFPSLSHSRTLLLSDSWNGQSEKHGFYDEIRGQGNSSAHAPESGTKGVNGVGEHV